MFIEIKPNGLYPKRSFKTQALKAWTKFFTIADDSCDVAHWLLDPYAGFIRLSVKVTKSDEAGPEWEPYTSVDIRIEGISELVLDEESNARDDVDDEVAEFRSWAERGILEAFQTAGILKKYDAFNPDEENFAIVSSPTDWGLMEDDLSLVWKNKPRFTLKRIKTLQKSAHERSEAIIKEKGLKLVPISNDKVGKAMRKHFKDDVVDTWKRFFADTNIFHNVAHWSIFPSGEVLDLTAQHSSIDETDANRNEERNPHMVVVDPGMLHMDTEQDDFLLKYHVWLEEHIMNVFHSARIKKIYERYNPEGKNFAVVISDNKLRLHEAPYVVHWSNSPNFTAGRIRAQQKAAIKKRRAALEKEVKKTKVKLTTKQPDRAVIKNLVKTFYKASFKAKALKLWTKYFDLTEEFQNIAHWEIYPGTGSVFLSAQHSSINESASERINDREIYAVFLNNWDRMLKKGITEENAIATFRLWVEEGIMEAFKSAVIKKRLRQYNSGDKQFAVLSTVGSFAPMVDDELSMLWGNNSKFTVARIKSQQRAAIKKAR